MKLTFNIEIDENKRLGEKEINLQIGQDFWVSSLLSEFINEDSSEVQFAMFGMMANKKESYNNLYDKLNEIKIGVAAHVSRGEMKFKIEL